ncbi:hypothetical protein AB0N06_20745 [Streptomyces sp. NPDC051020]|uniref:hypothetical protein n=1 Tax=Streptomyces sp. NPDC051020 TaxID=3155409 RepID=UPI00341A9D8A
MRAVVGALGEVVVLAVQRALDRALTAAEASAWTADQRARARTGRLLLALPLFVAAGTAP